uniref:Uncharacterized protein n=1 Tax=Vespula pensylvanica TaxID=30213 RepID=A0A834PFS9_VESPE|nr:hypothetical protein H0235_001284 [Vespula pensylvanica]
MIFARATSVMPSDEQPSTARLYLIDHQGFSSLIRLSGMLLKDITRHDQFSSSSSSSSVVVATAVVVAIVVDSLYFGCCILNEREDEKTEIFLRDGLKILKMGPVGEVGGVRLPLQSLHGYGSVFMYSALTSPGGGSGQAGGGGGEVTLRLREPEDIPEEVLARLEDTATLSISLQGDAVLRLGAAAAVHSPAVLSKEFSNVPFSIVSRSESMENIQSNSYIRAEEIKEKNRAKEKIAVTKRLKRISCQKRFTEVAACYEVFGLSPREEALSGNRVSSERVSVKPDD